MQYDPAGKRLQARAPFPTPLSCRDRGKRCPVSLSGTPKSPAALEHRHRGRLAVEEAPELARPARMLELAQRLGLDLTDALTGHRELLANFFERVVGVHADAEAHPEHA